MLSPHENGDTYEKPRKQRSPKIILFDIIPVSYKSIVDKISESTPDKLLNTFLKM